MLKIQELLKKDELLTKVLRRRTDYIQVINAGGTDATLYMVGNAHNEFSGFFIG